LFYICPLADNYNISPTHLAFQTRPVFWMVSGLWSPWLCSNSCI